jgi:hypothetical protein
MKIPILTRASSFAMLIVLLPGIACAMPSQTVSQFVAWAKANPALHGLVKDTNQMDATPYYKATFTAGGTAGNFTADIGEKSTVIDETVAVDTLNESYDILKHRDTASLMLSTVYGSNVAADFKDAASVGSWVLFGEHLSTALYRGKLYGYEASFASVKVIPVSNVDQEARTIKDCTTHPCGD